MGTSSRLIIVANRLPVHRSGRGSDWHSSAGGLVTAMAPVLKRRSGTWVGWAGGAGPAPRPFRHDGIDIRPVELSKQEVEDFYHNMSNRTFWPLYHDAIRTPEFQRNWWRSYVKVNYRFARTAARQARPGDVVWVHDYQLQLVPRMVRQMCPGARVGFFLHIPFPPEELFAWLPWRGEILQGLLGADLVGFQTQAGAQNFSRLARHYTTAEGTDAELEYDGRRVRVAAFPISIDFEWFDETASRPESMARAADIRKRMGGSRRIILSVDRLDYTKGIPHRLAAFEELLKKRKVSVDDCVLVQIAVPSRETVDEYAELRRQIEETVGRINGEFSVPGRVAVHYFRRNFSREELTAFYRAADVMLVTPLRDGMNLVAKEYVATRSDSSGVLVLSEFAGAASELRRALLVNPRDVDQLSATILRALDLPRREARMRMSILRTVVRRHDVHEWARGFMEALRA